MRDETRSDTELAPKTAHHHAPAAAGAATRRAVLVGAAALATAAAARVALAADEGAHAGHAGHGDPKYTEAVRNKKHRKLAAAAHECVETGQLCISHCMETFVAGDTTMADCAFAVQQMMPVCAATAELAAYDSKHLRPLLQACIGVCEDCEKACREHEEHQPECKACADACAELVRIAKQTLA